MLQIEGKEVTINHFPDGSLLLKEQPEELLKDKKDELVIKWNYENNEELLVLYFLTKHCKEAGYRNIVLDMPYIPNARQDRVQKAEDVFTLKYFAELINSLEFQEVRVLDAHSNVSLALLNRVRQASPKPYIEKVIGKIKEERGREPLMFYPDEGAGKRYGGMIQSPYCFGIKKRDWSTGKIKGLDVAGETGQIAGNDVLIVDDICSYGGTFLYSARKLHELGAENIYLFISHCEASVLKGELPECELIQKIYTTDSIFGKKHDKIEVLNLERM